jgi:hypothetical protein
MQPKPTRRHAHPRPTCVWVSVASRGRAPLRVCRCLGRPQRGRPWIDSSLRLRLGSKGLRRCDRAAPELRGSVGRRRGARSSCILYTTLTPGRNPSSMQLRRMEGIRVTAPRRSMSRRARPRRDRDRRAGVGTRSLRRRRRMVPFRLDRHSDSCTVRRSSCRAERLPARAGRRRHIPSSFRRPRPLLPQRAPRRRRSCRGRGPPPRLAEHHHRRTARGRRATRRSERGRPRAVWSERSLRSLSFRGRRDSKRLST